MKPIVTWVVLASTRSVKVLSHRGPGHGLIPIAGQDMTAPKADIPNEKAGVGHSIAGPSRSAVEETDPQAKIDAGFAKDVMTQLCKAKNDKQFDRLILVAGPRMLGLLRAEMDASLQSVLLGEIPKDLSSQPVGAVATHLGALLAI